jgi:serine/threonine protein kinase
MVNGEAEAECTRASLLGRYEIGRTLGEGNFGKVKYARHLATGAHFAIKILDRNKILSLRFDDQIRREIGTLKLLKHPNVVRLHEVTSPLLSDHHHPLAFFLPLFLDFLSWILFHSGRVHRQVLNFPTSPDNFFFSHET